MTPETDNAIPTRSASTILGSLTCETITSAVAISGELTSTSTRSLKTGTLDAITVHTWPGDILAVPTEALKTTLKNMARAIKVIHNLFFDLLGRDTDTGLIYNCSIQLI